MSNGNNTNNQNNDMFGNQGSPKEIQEREEELHLFHRFRNVITGKLEEMTTETEEQQKVYKMSEHEKRILMQMQGMGLAEGIAAGAATFLFLRRGPFWINRYVLNRRGGGGAAAAASKNPFHNTAGKSSTNMPPSFSSSPSNGGYQLSNPFQSAGNNAAANNSAKFSRSRNPIIRGIWFTFDASFSLMMAANVTMKYTDLDRFRNALVELPLTEGNSLVSDAFCDGLTDELQKIQHENSPAYQRIVAEYQKGGQSQNLYGKSPTDDEVSPLALYVESIDLFTKNCQRRAFRQRELLQEQGGAEFVGFEDSTSTDTNSSSFSPDIESSSFDYNNNDDNNNKPNEFQSVPIPPPGVAKDGPRLVRIIEENSEGESSFNNDPKNEYVVVYSHDDNSGPESFS